MQADEPGPAFTRRAVWWDPSAQNQCRMLVPPSKDKKNNQQNQNTREKTLWEGKSKANLFETNGLFSGEGAEDSSWGVQQRCFQRRLGRGVPPLLLVLWTDGVHWVTASTEKCSREIQPSFSAMRSLQVSAANEISDKVQQSFSELPHSCPASPGPRRSSHGRGERGGWPAAPERGDVSSAGRPQLLSVRHAPRCLGYSSVCVGQSDAAAAGRGQLGSSGLPHPRDAGRREVRQGCQAPRGGSGNSHANNLQPVLLDAAAFGVAGIPVLHVLFTKIHVQLIASFRARVCVPTGGKRAAQRQRPAGAPPRRCGRRGDPAPLSSGLRSLPRVSSASKPSPREGRAGRGQCPPRGCCPPYVPLRACEQQPAARRKASPSPGTTAPFGLSFGDVCLGKTEGTRLWLSSTLPGVQATVPGQRQEGSSPALIYRAQLRGQRGPNVPPLQGRGLRTGKAILF